MSASTQKSNASRPFKKGLWILLLLLIVLLVLIILPFSQTQIIKRIAGNELGEEVSLQVDRAFFKNLRTFRVENLLLEGSDGDTLIFLEEANMRIQDISIKEKYLRLNYLIANGLRSEIKRLEEGGYNYSFLSKESDEDGDDWLLSIEKIHLENSSFSYHDLRKSPLEGIQTDWNYLDLDGLATRISDFQVYKGAMEANIHSLSARDKSGLEIEEMQSAFVLNSKSIEFNDLFLRTPRSYYEGFVLMNFSRFNDFQKVFSRVPMEFSVDSAYLSDKDLQLIHKNLSSLNGEISLQANIKGTLDNLVARDVFLKNSHGLKYQGRVDLRGLPNVETTLIDLKIDNASFSASSIARSISDLAVPERLFTLGEMTFKGGFFGYIKDFVANGFLKTALGSADTDINFKLKDGEPVYSGILETYNFNIGPLIGNENIGGIDFDGKLSGSGIDRKSATANIDGVFSSLIYEGYQYQNITFKGQLSDQTVTGDLVARDPNANFDFSGTVDLSSERPKYNFSSDLKSVNLLALGFDDDSISVSGKMELNMQGNSSDDITGSVIMQDFVLSKNNKDLPIGKLNLTSVNSQAKGRTISLRSDLVDADLSGQFKLSTLGDALTTYLNKQLPHYVDRVEYEGIQDLTFSISLRKAQPVLDILGFEFIKLNTGSVFGYFNDSESELQMSFQSASVQYLDYSVKDILLKSKGVGENMEIELNAASFSLKDSVFARDILYSSSIKEQLIDFSLEAQNQEILADIDLYGLANLDSTVMDLRFTDSSFVRLQDVRWFIDQGGVMSYLDEGLNFSEFKLQHADHLLYLTGRASESDSDSITLVMNNFDLKQVNPWTRQYDTEFDGKAFVELNARALLGTPKFSADFESCDFTIDGTLLGDVEMRTNYSEHENIMTVIASVQDANLPATDPQGNPLVLSTPLQAEGLVRFGSGSPELDIDILMERSPIDLLNKILNPILDDISGNASAKLKLYGTLDLPLLNGEARLDTAHLSVPYLNTEYFISSADSNTIRFTDYSIDFDSLLFYDGSGVVGKMVGSVYHDYFESTVTDLKITAEQAIEVLNTGPADNSLYYGRARATGYAEFLGPTNNMDIIIYAKSEGKSLLELPLDLEDYNTSGSFVRFVNPGDTISAAEDAVKLYPYQLDMTLELTPEAQVNIVFDRVAGDVITGSGSGNLKMKVDRFGDFKMTGDYAINAGDYLFTYENLINKRFVIDPGGKLIWDGDPYNARMDLTAVYKLRASPKDLLNYGVADTSNLDSRSNRRLPVELKMLLGGTLLQPDIAFDISMPSINEEDLTDPIALGLREINSIPEKQNMQVFGLLILGRFIQPESGISFQGAGVNSLSELLSNQFSNLISQYTGNLNVGIRYSDNDFLEDNGSLRGGELQVALNTTLFNDRVLIDGNFDVGNDYINRNIGTDFTVEYMITEDGNFRVKAFNKLDDRQIINNFQTNYRQGVGISYRREFDDINELYEPVIEGVGRKLQRIFPRISNWFKGQRSAGASRE